MCLLPLRSILDLDDEWEPVLFTPLGYGNAEPRDTPRKAIEELVIYKYDLKLKIKSRN